jgi:hypothetical protein
MGENAQDLAASIKTVREIATAADLRVALQRSGQNGLELFEAKFLRIGSVCESPALRPLLPNPIKREFAMRGRGQHSSSTPEEIVCPSVSAIEFIAEDGAGVRLRKPAPPAVPVEDLNASNDE